MGTANIMIVEDNFTVAADCQTCLINLGYNVTSIQASGEESIERAGIEQPDFPDSNFQFKKIIQEQGGR